MTYNLEEINFNIFKTPIKSVNYFYSGKECEHPHDNISSEINKNLETTFTQRDYKFSSPVLISRKLSFNSDIMNAPTKLPNRVKIDFYDEEEKIMFNFEKQCNKNNSNIHCLTPRREINFDDNKETIQELSFEDDNQVRTIFDKIFVDVPKTIDFSSYQENNNLCQQNNSFLNSDFSGTFFKDERYIHSEQKPNQINIPRSSLKIKSAFSVPPEDNKNLTENIIICQNLNNTKSEFDSNFCYNQLPNTQIQSHFKDSSKFTPLKENFIFPSIITTIKKDPQQYVENGNENQIKNCLISKKQVSYEQTKLVNSFKEFSESGNNFSFEDQSQKILEYIKGCIYLNLLDEKNLKESQNTKLNFVFNYDYENILQTNTNILQNLCKILFSCFFDGFNQKNDIFFGFMDENINLDIIDFEKNSFNKNMEIIQNNIRCFIPGKHQEKDFDHNNKKFIFSTSGKAILNTPNKEGVDFVISLRTLIKKDQLSYYLLNNIENKFTNINNIKNDHNFQILRKVFNIDCIKLKLGKF